MNYLIFFGGGLFLILILWWFRKRNSSTMLPGIDNAKDNDEEETGTDDKKSLIQKAKEEFKKNRNRILIGGFSYIALLVTFAILLPDKWAMYWGHQDFFWITQVYIAIMIATIWLDIWSVKWFLRIAFTVILAVYGIGKIPEGPPKGTGTEVVMQQTTITRSIVAYPGKWTAVHVDKHYNGRWFKDGSREFENLKRLVKVRFNGKSVESESMTPEGNIIEVNYKSGETIRLIEFQSLGTEPVYIIVEFIKKRVIA